MARKPDLSEVVLATRSVLPPGDRPSLLLVDKPASVTSFSVVKRIRFLSGIRKVGHSGTLDPMATGLLIVMLGRATRLMDSLLKLDKSYEGIMRLGERTPSFDAETPVVERRDASGVSLSDLRSTVATYVGTIEQETPVYSAVKVSGERLYRKARRGDTVVLPKRIVDVHRFEVERLSERDVSFRVDCSSGTYI
ncbi:MAG: tRNA pseudouridine(55) synthase TruB, partial [Rhodothermales bacterium]|nr:tRNA pseudouridine(55) synthase TruB [Rhodothermales bacterium]